MKRTKDFFRENSLPCSADGFDAGANAAAGSGNFFVRGAGDALLEIHQARVDESRMGVGVDEAWQHDVAGTVDFGDLLAILFKPGIAEGIFGLAHGNDFAAEAKDSGVFEEAEFGERGAAAGAG